MPTIDDAWFVAEGQRDGRPVLIRGRQHLDVVAGGDSHPNLLRIVWQYDVNDKSGLRPSELNEKMSDFEETVFALLEKDLLCIFFCVYVHNGLKEWAAYCSDLQTTCDRFNEALAGRDPYPVQLTTQHDPNWQEYKQLMTETAMRNDL